MANSKTIPALIAVVILLTPGVFAKNGRGKQMVSVESIVDALLHKDVTIAAIARVIGTPEGRRSGGFDVKPSDQHFRRALIGADEHQNVQDAPAYIDLRNSDEKPFTFSELLPKCKEWKLVPANPISSQYVYGCNAVATLDEVSINMIVTLSGDESEPSSVVERVLLQRNTK